MTQVPGQPNKVILQRECVCILHCSFQEGFMTKAEPGRRRKGLTAEGIPNPLKWPSNLFNHPGPQITKSDSTQGDLGLHKFFSTPLL